MSRDQPENHLTRITRAAEVREPSANSADTPARLPLHCGRSMSYPILPAFRHRPHTRTVLYRQRAKLPAATCSRAGASKRNRLTLAALSLTRYIQTAKYRDTTGQKIASLPRTARNYYSASQNANTAVFVRHNDYLVPSAFVLYGRNNIVSGA